MADLWEFRNVKVDADHATYADGTVVPAVDVDLYLNGVKVGEAEVHMHKRRGRDGKTDVSFGFTGVVFTVDRAGGGN